MNISTGEMRSVADLTDEEKASGQWIPVAKKWARKYQQKQPVTEADKARIIAAEQRRKRRGEKRRQDFAQ